MKRLLVICLLCFLFKSKGSTQAASITESPRFKCVFKEISPGHYELRNAFKWIDKSNHDNPRLVAITLDVTLGLLGVHRLYLGTDVKVPVLYTLTFGGGGLLWLADLGLLIFTDDIKPYMDNPHVFMWVPANE